MEKPAPDPKKLLQSWMEWERGEVTPGRVMANLKTGGFRELLEDLVAATSVESVRSGGQGDALPVPSAENVIAGPVAGPVAGAGPGPNRPRHGRFPWWSAGNMGPRGLAPASVRSPSQVRG